MKTSRFVEIVIALGVVAVVALATGTYIQRLQPILVTAEAIEEALLQFGAPERFVAVQATTSATNLSFAIATSSNLSIFGTTTFYAYGSSTIHTPENTVHAFEILNAATSSVFSVSTIDGSAVLSGELTVASCVGCGAGFSSNWTYFADSNFNDFLTPSSTPIGITVNASSTFSGTTTFNGRIGSGSSSPHNVAGIFIEPMFSTGSVAMFPDRVRVIRMKYRVEVPVAHEVTSSSSQPIRELS